MLSQDEIFSSCFLCSVFNKLSGSCIKHDFKTEQDELKNEAQIMMKLVACISSLGLCGWVKLTVLLASTIGLMQLHIIKDRRQNK